ncbi:hypothetical protein HPP92_009554 [Vanilla planifolia]|uniref:F-box domain-containing protein n=1 Tax=Vanilla planifolia TaxID=51239 RepID=A0A835RCL5_VANPL|nr:hypothetical protein HPP92_009554 [Vanilla planifolia]
MAQERSTVEVLKAVFPLLDDGRDLASCMSVSRLWRDIAMDDYFWKCVCAKRWPSVCKRPPPALSFRRFYRTFSKSPPAEPLPPPQLSLQDLEFYIDIWSDLGLLFSDAVSGSDLRNGIKNPPREAPSPHRIHLDKPDYKMVLQVEPRIAIPLGHGPAVSVLVARRDTNKMARILDREAVDYVDRNVCKAMAYEYLKFSPAHPFTSRIRAWVSLLFSSVNDDDYADVFGIEIDFCDAASSEREVLLLLDMLDWK